MASTASQAPLATAMTPWRIVEPADPQAASIRTASAPPLAEKVGDQSAELSLLVQRAAGHVTDVDRVDALHTSVIHRRPPRGNGQTCPTPKIAT
jgi:hypothetical protein